MPTNTNMQVIFIASGGVTLSCSLLSATVGAALNTYFSTLGPLPDGVPMWASAPGCTLASINGTNSGSRATLLINFFGTQLAYNSGRYLLGREGMSQVAMAGAIACDRTTFSVALLSSPCESPPLLVITAPFLYYVFRSAFVPACLFASPQTAVLLPFSPAHQRPVLRNVSSTVLRAAVRSTQPP